MAPAAATLTWLSALEARFWSAPAAATCTTAELEDRHTTSGAIAPAAAISARLSTLKDRLRSVPTAASCNPAEPSPPIWAKARHSTIVLARLPSLIAGERVAAGQNAATNQRGRESHARPVIHGGGRHACMAGLRRCGIAMWQHSGG